MHSSFCKEISLKFLFKKCPLGGIALRRCGTLSLKRSDTEKESCKAGFFFIENLSNEFRFFFSTRLRTRQKAKRNLCLLDCSGRALSSAGTAVDAKICVDLELSISHADCANRALCFTSTTSYTSVTNCKCHDKFLLCLLWSIIHFIMVVF